MDAALAWDAHVAAALNSRRGKGGESGVGGEADAGKEPGGARSAGRGTGGAGGEGAAAQPAGEEAGTAGAGAGPRLAQSIDELLGLSLGEEAASTAPAPAAAEGSGTEAAAAGAGEAGKEAAGAAGGNAESSGNREGSSSSSSSSSGEGGMQDAESRQGPLEDAGEGEGAEGPAQEAGEGPPTEGARAALAPHDMLGPRDPNAFVQVRGAGRVGAGEGAIECMAGCLGGTELAPPARWDLLGFLACLSFEPGVGAPVRCAGASHACCAWLPLYAVLGPLPCMLHGFSQRRCRGSDATACLAVPCAVPLHSIQYHNVVPCRASAGGGQADGRGLPLPLGPPLPAAAHSGRAGDSS